MKNQNRFHEELHDKDTENQTYGCRHTNSNICKNNSMYEKCAFVRDDNICLLPPSSWKKQYLKLLEEKNV